MVIYTKFNVNSNTINHVLNIKISKSTGNNNISSKFIANIENKDGIYNNSFSVGDEISVYADKTSNPTTLQFLGILEDIDYEGSPNKEVITLRGRDYTARLMDRTVEPEVYTSTEISVIIKDIISKYTDDITVTNVQATPIIISRLAINQKTVYDAIKSLADQAEYNFYVDNNKDLHFQPKSSTSSGLTFDNTNVLHATFKEHRDTVKNKIWVYGDRYLDARKNTFIAGSPLGGSVFTTLFQPHNTQVTVNGNLQKGGIFNMSITSGANYLVNFHDQKIIFISGTNYGDSIPASGDAIIVNYDASLPIVKVGDNIESQVAYGKRVEIITDKSIKDPQSAQERLTTELNAKGIPKKEGKLSIQGVLNVTPSETAIVNLPNHNINNKTYEILSAEYDFNQTNNFTERVLQINVNKRLVNLTDTIKLIMQQLRQIQGADISSADTITRFQYTTGSVGIRTSGLKVYTRAIGNSFILGHGNTGSYSTGSSLTGSVFSTNYDLLGSSVIGSQFIGSTAPTGKYDSGLRVYWRFESGTMGIGSDAVPGVVGSNTGSLFGGAGPSQFPTLVNGTIGSGLSFGSPSAVIIQGNLGLTNSGLSISNWIYLNSTNLNGTFGHIGQPPSVNGFQIGVGSIGTNQLGNDLVLGYMGVRWILPGQHIGIGWHHVAGTIDNAGIPKAYLDGSLIGSYPGALMKTPTGNTSIGAEGTVATFLSGIIDDIAFYNKELSASEVGSLFDKTMSPLDIGSVKAYFPMNSIDSTGSAIKDYSLSGAGIPAIPPGTNIATQSFIGNGGSFFGPGSFISG